MTLAVLWRLDLTGKIVKNIDIYFFPKIYYNNPKKGDGSEDR
jgi:hypothetical protein